MSQWRCKIDGHEIAPLSFAELAELVRDGKLKEGAQVCRAGTMNWEPVWHVPGLLRAAGIVAPGDSAPPEVASVQRQEALDRASAQRDTGYFGTPAPPGARRPSITRVGALRGLVAACVGLLAVGFFYHWANQAALAFPMPPVEVEGETIDCYFPLVGRCTILECALLYVDVFAVAAVATWHAIARRVISSG